MMDTKYLRRAQHSAEWLVYFVRFFFRQFYHQNGLQVASALAFSTLLALVPLITVMFTILHGMPVFENIGRSIQAWIFTNFVPAFGETILENLNGFARKASELTVTGILVLFLVAVMMMVTIDNALNSIWQVRKGRNWIARLPVYIAILTLGPLLLGIGLFSTSYVLSLPLIRSVDSGLGVTATLLAWLPFLTTTMAFSILYILIPDCYVLRKHAIAGGVVAAILFELAKFGFGIYVKSIAGYETIYGALAVVPIFLIWIYTSWVVVLLGAHISFCLSSFRLSSEKRGSKTHDWSFAEFYRIIYLLWQAQKSGKSLSYTDMKKQGLSTPQYQLNEIMGHLYNAGWVNAAGKSRWILAKDMDEVTLLDMHRLVPKSLAEIQLDEVSTGDITGLNQILSHFQKSLQDNLSVPVSTLLKQEQDETAQK